MPLHAIDSSPLSSEKWKPKFEFIEFSFCLGKYIMNELWKIKTACLYLIVKIYLLGWHKYKVRLRVIEHLMSLSILSGLMYTLSDWTKVWEHHFQYLVKHICTHGNYWRPHRNENMWFLWYSDLFVLKRHSYPNHWLYIDWLAFGIPEVLITGIFNKVRNDLHIKQLKKYRLWWKCLISVKKWQSWMDCCR